MRRMPHVFVQGSNADARPFYVAIRKRPRTGQISSWRILDIVYQAFHETDSGIVEPLLRRPCHAELQLHELSAETLAPVQ